MLDFPRWKVWSIWLAILLGIAFAVPSLFPKSEVANWPKWVPRTQINLGLDLAGGSQLQLEADSRDAAKQRLQAMEETVTTELRRGTPRIAIGDVSTQGGRLSFMVRDPAQLDSAVERLRALTQPVGLTGTRDWNVSVVDSTRIVLTPTEEGSAKALKDSMTVARDVVRRRIDPSGTKEITVINQGQRRILVQVPGVEDPDALKALIGQTARLEFKLVDLTADPAQVAEGRAPPRPAGQSSPPPAPRPAPAASAESPRKTSTSPSPSSSTTRCFRRPTSTSRSSAARRRSAAISRSRAPTSWRSRSPAASCR